MKLLGPNFDLHLGGEDLAFPHHEDEIAQSEGAGVQPPGQRFVKYWLHGAHLLVEGKKMSKSLGNFFTLRDLTAKGYSGREIRFLLLSAHYRETFNFTLEGLDGGRTALMRLDECLGKIQEVAGTATAPADQKLLDAFTDAMDEDLNVSAGWGIVFDWVREMNRRLAMNQIYVSNPGPQSQKSSPFIANRLSSEQAASALATWERIDSVFGLGRKSEAEAPPEIQALFEQRQAARAVKDFKRADAVRAELKDKGWLIEDTPKGARLKRA